MEKIDKGIKLISVSGKPGTWYRADKYHIENGKIVKNAPRKMTTQQSDTTTDGSTNLQQSDTTATTDSTNAKNAISTVKNVV